MTNVQRAKNGRAAFAVHADTADEEDSRQSQLADLLADLMHFADFEGLDFDQALSMGTDHYGEETTTD